MLDHPIGTCDPTCDECKRIHAWFREKLEYVPFGTDEQKAEAQEKFQKVAEEFAGGITVDPSATKRNELQGNLLRAAVNAAQAKANLAAASKGLRNAEGAIGFRMAEREAQNALSTYIEWEAGLL